MKLLFEIGTEELPAGAVMPGLDFLATELARKAEQARLAHGPIERFATPRRLALRVSDVAARTPDLKETRQGPAVAVAFDADGNPTRAALGFARGQGVAVEDLQRITTPKGEYVAADRLEPGRPAEEVLTALLSELIAAIPWPKPMRWGWSEDSWARPVHWIVALLEDRVLPVGFAGIEAGAASRGHRFHHPEPVPLVSPDAYEEALLQADVWVDSAARRAEIARLAQDAVAPDRPVAVDGLLDELAQLVELPLVAAGTFDPSFLKLPREVLISEMREHQRYFAVEDRTTGQLVNRFVITYNTRVRDPDRVVQGNRRVLVARLADGAFFLRRDQARALADRIDDLRRVVYLKDLGSVADKAERIARLVGRLGPDLFPEATAAAERAASLCKADLTTEMVGEFPELQGIMGREYARHDGEPEAVAVAIAEHYQPRGAADEVPRSPAGILVGLADRTDTLAGCFALGLLPSGTADPYGLRRAALGILRTALEHGLVFSLRQLVRDAIDGLPLDDVDREATAAQLEDFIKRRLKHQLVSAGEAVTPDVADAVLATGLDDISAAAAKITALAKLRHQADFEPLAVAFKRVNNILEQAPDGPVDTDLLVESAERALWTNVETFGAKAAGELARRDYDAAAVTLIGFKEPVDRFFDEVLVMAEDAAVRTNRLALLRDLRSLFEQMADISRIQPGASRPGPEP